MENGFLKTFSNGAFALLLFIVILLIFSPLFAQDDLSLNEDTPIINFAESPALLDELEVLKMREYETFLETISVKDTPADDGKSISIKWKVPESPHFENSVLNISRKEESGNFIQINKVETSKGHYLDNSTYRGGLYVYRFNLKVDDKELISIDVGPVESKDNWFKVYNWNSLIIVLLFTIFVVFYISKARKDPDSLFIRRISSLDAVEEAVGRSTEMGRKMFYIPGIADISDPQTIASLSILGHVAKVTAEYGAELEVPNKDPLTMATAREIVKESYLKAGRPDAFNDDMVNYVTYDQFAYTAGVNGKMIREKPAANFFIGWFAAESLILAETGQSTGAIQVSGTAQIDQLPFFVAACDYTLIGEELYAAGAYLSREPMALGSIKAQDLMKYVILVIGALAVICASIGWDWTKYIFGNLSQLN